LSFHFAVCDLTGERLALDILPESVKKIALADDGKSLAVLTSERLEVWGLAAPAITKRLIADNLDTRVSPRDITQLRFSADGQIGLATDAGEIRVWRPGEAMPVALRVNPSKGLCIVFSPDGRRLLAAAADNPDAYLWDLAERDPGASVSLLSGHGRGVAQIAYSPDGRLIATADHDGLVRLWEPEHDPMEYGLIVHGEFRPENARVVGSHLDDSARMRFSPHGRWLFAVAPRPGATRMPTPDDTPAELVRLSKELAGRKLTRREREKYLLESTNP
jgi:WD40 repeat protein